MVGHFVICCPRGPLVRFYVGLLLADKHCDAMGPNVIAANPLKNSLNVRQGHVRWAFVGGYSFSIIRIPKSNCITTSILNSV